MDGAYQGSLTFLLTAVAWCGLKNTKTEATNQAYPCKDASKIDKSAWPEKKTLKWTSTEFNIYIIKWKWATYTTLWYTTLLYH